jgi:hypothetical protein
VINEAYERLRSARERTIAEGAARIWKANVDDGAETPPPFESTGIVNFATRRASLETRVSEAHARLLLGPVEDAARRGHQEAAWSTEDVRAWNEVSVFIDDLVYERAGPKQRWVRDKRGRREHPLLPLDMLDTVSTDVRAGARDEGSTYVTTPQLPAIGVTSLISHK